MSSSAPNLRRLFMALQEELLAGLKANKVIDHPGAKGAATEGDWLRILRQHLPQRYSADRAMVIDADGEVSDYLDIVIYDRLYSPVIFARHREQYIPAESVLAAFEVKQSLNASNVQYAGKKIASVRKLRRTNAHVHTLRGVEPGRPLFRIVGGLLTTYSEWRPPLGEPCAEVLRGLASDEQLDLGCSLADGAFRVGYEPSFSFTASRAEVSLVSWFIWLLTDLQAKANVPAIDWTEYGRAIEGL